MAERPTTPSVAAAICASLRDDPLAWTQGKHLITHRSGVQVWTSNGFWFYALDNPRKILFGALGKIRFAWAYWRWRKWMIAPLPPVLPDPAPDILASLRS